MNVVAVIPSLNPTSIFVEYVDGLIEKGFRRIIVVDDGSKDSYQNIFDELKVREQCTVLRHAVNLGKGRALKTGFNHYLNNFSNEYSSGVVTADADGQHSPDDTLKIATNLDENKDCLVLGTRNFNFSHVPFKSKNGNKITTLVFSVLYSKKINDTQTGLRGIPYEFVKKCLELNGERFEYEIGMLIEAVRANIQMVEVEIETIYYDSNRETHFNAVMDSLRIYSLMFSSFIKFSMTGIASFGLDIALFALLVNLLLRIADPSTSILLSTVGARILSSVFNYTLNRNVVFRSKSKLSKTLLKYFSLSVIQMLISSLLVTQVFYLLNFDATPIKIMVDLCLFFISYQIQRRWVFK